MTASKDPDEGTDAVLSENILRIADELVRQIGQTKKLVIIMVATVVIAVPAAWHVAPLVSSARDSFMAVGYATILLALAFLALGVRQWMVLAKWTERYKAYKELQKKIDAQLDFEADQSEESGKRG